MSSKKALIFICAVYSFLIVVASFPSDKQNRTSRSSRTIRVNLPLLGLGYNCDGCPPNFCDDDPAIIRGYCCGCARFFDDLPVRCSRFIDCPLNEYDLCEEYEYMMHCCCS